MPPDPAREISWTRLRRAAALGSLLVALATALFLGACTPWGTSSGLRARLEALRGPLHVPRRALVARTVWHTAALPWLGASAIWALLPLRRSIKLPAALALVLLDLGLTGRPLVRAAPVPLGRSISPFHEIFRAEPRPFRIYAIGARPDEPGGYTWDGLPTAWQAVTGGLELANGDLTLRLQEWDDALRVRDVSSAGLARLGLLNVRYLLSTRPLDRAAGLVLVGRTSWSDPDPGRTARTDVFLYRNSHCLPRAWVVPASRIGVERARRLGDPGWMDFLHLAQRVRETCPEAAAVEYRTPEHVLVRVRIGEPGYLIVSDPWYPGWQARDNGRPVSLLRAGALRGIPLTAAGPHTVELRYRPTWLRSGLCLTVLAAAFAAVLGLGRPAARKALPSGAEHQGGRAILA